MSEYKLYEKERNSIESLLEKGYRIKGVKDNLEGAIVVFEKEGKVAEHLQVMMADTRKYISNLIAIQNKGA
ncbi:hypothetical protein GH741_03460 [Aquibacillus halophilus]|uniref:Uncharacterized protein n=1 Tax=Aquibacillus halophilus TaxID=930132 RepID=A0A6A8DCX4_9BACI|nr:hypothetical protein [Aquibacillus halophilus]MRH41729.1 hypothetical protein [Aquibacillus halophilus]